MSERTIKLSIAALGGQGGGVLTDWLIEIAEASGYIVQSTSVPGVAQRTGATIYYLEFFSRALAERAGREPVMALMPVSGDVDCVIASELAEAGRAIQRGLVSPGRTTLISSTHRSYAIAEKSAMGDGTGDSSELIELVRRQGKRVILFDMEATAERHQSVISAVLLGALCGATVLPFSQAAFEHAITQGGLAVKTNLAAFEDARLQAQQGGLSTVTPEQGAPFAPLPARAASARLQPLLDRMRALPAAVQPIALEGARRTLDFQDPTYASLYLDRLAQVVSLERRVAGGSSALAEATARALALWMTFEDTIRVAQLKTRGTRFERVREEIRATPGQLFGITEFMKPRVAEIAGTLPAALGAWVLRSRRASRGLERFTGGRQIRTKTLSGFLLLYTLAGLRRWRRSTLRFREEDARIEDWLGRIQELAPRNFALAVELARAQRLIKGYGETYERGWGNFRILYAELEQLAARPDGAQLLARLQVAALADEEGVALGRELAALGSRAAQAAAGVPA